jgi:hypothetical protein
MKPLKYKLIEAFLMQKTNMQFEDIRVELCILLLMWFFPLMGSFDEFAIYMSKIGNSVGKELKVYRISPINS